MRARAWVVASILFCALVAGCNSQAPSVGPLPTPSPAPLPQPSSPATIPPNPSGEAARIIQVLSPWGDEPTTANAPAWAGVDESGRLVLAASVLGRLDEFHAQAARWFQDGEVQRAIWWSTEWQHIRPTEEWGALSQLTKERFQTWPASSAPFSAGEWSARIDLHAERAHPLQGFSATDLDAVARRWVTQRAGNRLVDLSGSTEEMRILLRPDDHSAQEKRNTANVLAAVPLLIDSHQAVRVAYEGANAAGEVRVNWRALIDWGDELSGTTGPQAPLSQAELVTLLGRRESLSQILPGGARLTLGRNRSNGGRGVALIEAQVSPASSSDQLWSTYQDVVDRFYAETPELEYVYLLIRRGNEIEFSEHWRRVWQIKQQLMQVTGSPLEPVLFPAMASWYDHYTVLGH